MADGGEVLAKVEQIWKDLVAADESDRPLAREALLPDMEWLLTTIAEFGRANEDLRDLNEILTTSIRRFESRSHLASPTNSESSDPPVDASTPRLWLGSTTEDISHWQWDRGEWEHFSVYINPGNIFVLDNGGPTPPPIELGARIIACDTLPEMLETPRPPEPPQRTESSCITEPRIWTGGKFRVAHWCWFGSNGEWAHYEYADLNNGEIFVGGSGDRPTVKPDRYDLGNCSEKDW